MGVPACANDIDDNVYGNAGTDGNDDADGNEDADGNDAADEIDDSDDAITIGSGKISGYGKQVQEFVRGHKAEIAQFVADNKQALADAKAEIAEAIKTGEFDVAHYQQQLQALVDKHDLGEYAKKFEAYMAAHKAEVAQFVADNKAALADVADRIKASVAAGDFDYAHYQQQLQQFVTEHDLGAYRERLDAFVAAHRAEIAQFVADNKQAVADVQEDIEDLVATGEFDFAHYKEQIQDLVDRFDEGLSKYAGADYDFEESSAGAGAAAGQAGKKTLMGYANTGQYDAEA